MGRYKVAFVLTFRGEVEVTADSADAAQASVQSWEGLSADQMAADSDDVEIDVIEAEAVSGEGE